MIFAFLFMSVFSAVNALIKIAAGTKVIAGSKGVPRLGRTFLISTVKAATNTVLNADAVAAFIRDTSKINRNKHDKLASFIATIYFLLSLFLTPFFLTMPNTTATPMLVLMNLVVVSSIGGISFVSCSRTVPTFVYVVFVPLTCDVSSKVILKVVDCILVGLLYKRAGGLAPTVCVLTFVFIFGFFLWTFRSVKVYYKGT